MSATVGNAEELLEWLQGSGRAWGRHGVVVNPLADEAREPGYVEPVVPPPAPVHVLVQQLLGTVLQEGQVGESELIQPGTALGWGPSDEVVAWLRDEGLLEHGGDLLFVGEEAERRYGRVHYRDLVAVFTAPPQFIVLHGRSEIGQSDPLMLTDKVDGPRVILLGGRPWHVTYTDWKRKRA